MSEEKSIDIIRKALNDKNKEIAQLQSKLEEAKEGLSKIAQFVESSGKKMQRAEQILKSIKEE